MTAKSKSKSKPKTIDQYLATLSPDKRAALQKLRRTIDSTYPRVEEHFSYGLPAFRLDGKSLCWLGAAANHCAIYGLVGADKDDLKDYDTSGRGTIRFQPDDPLPAALVRKLLKARIEKNAAPRRKTVKRSARTR